MSNMSYCRFENTLSDLMDCYEAMQQDGVDSLKESREELNAAKEMIETMTAFIGDYGRKITDL